MRYIVDSLKQLVFDNKVDDIVTLHSEVLGRDKERILLDTDIFMQTSRHEGIGQFCMKWKSNLIFILLISIWILCNIKTESMKKFL